MLHCNTPPINWGSESGAQGVGSSMDIASRLRSHLSDKNTGSRIAKHLTVHGKQNHTIRVVRLPLKIPQTPSAVLAFEQYLFFLINPIINKLFIAGSSFVSEKEKLKRQLKNGTSVYIYFKNTLVAQTVTVQDASQLMGITRANVRTACFNDSYLTDFKMTTQPIIGAPVDIIDVAAFKTLLNSYRDIKLTHLYIDGKYANSYPTIQKIADATGFTMAQVKHAISRSDGYYNTSTNIRFTRTLQQKAPKSIITNAAILEHCANARKLVADKKAVYLYYKSQLVGKYTTITEAYNACPSISVKIRTVITIISRKGFYHSGDYIISSKLRLAPL